MSDRIDGSRLTDSLWRLYFSIGKRVSSWRVWRTNVGRQDIGRFLDGLVRSILPSPSRREGEIALFNGCVMGFPPGYQDRRLYQGGMIQHPTERATTHVLLEHLRPGMSAIDVGAHLGYYTLVASKLVGPEGRVYAFEPDPHHLNYLWNNVRRNGCENVDVECLAVSNRSGRVPFFSQAHSAGSSLFNTGQRGAKMVEVDTVTLDEYFAGHGWPPIDIVKIDIEGGERAAMEGMVGLFGRSPNVKLIFEVELRSLRASSVRLEDLLDFVGGLGFRNFYYLWETSVSIKVPDDIPTLVSKALDDLCVNVLAEK